MDELMAVFIVAITTLGVYRLFELFAHRKERLRIIEKLDAGNWGNGIDLNIFPKPTKRNYALTIGLLLIGVGLGLLVGYVIFITTFESTSNSHSHMYYEFKSIIIGACVLLFGGAALLAAYLIEHKLNNRND